MKLYIFRHGETYANAVHLCQGVKDLYPLDEVGRGQALALGRELAGLKLQVIYASPLSRAQQTAEFVAEPNKTPIITLDGLKEHDFGIVEGWPESKIAENYRELLLGVLAAENPKTFDWKMPGGESRRESLERFCREIEYIKNNCAYDIAGVATHGSIMSNYYYAVFHEARAFANCEYFIVEI